MRRVSEWINRYHSHDSSYERERFTRCVCCSTRANAWSNSLPSSPLSSSVRSGVRYLAIITSLEDTRSTLPLQPNHVMVEPAARSFRITGILWSRIFNPPLAVRAAIVFFSSSRHMPMRASTAKTGLLIHGCHLGAKGWHNVMWGDVRTQRLGRWVDPVMNISNSDSEYCTQIVHLAKGKFE